MNAQTFELLLFIGVVLSGICWALVTRKSKLSNGIIWQTGDLFPVLAVVFLLRSFIYEPFVIPSGSMLPTLLVDDFVLINKNSYGVRLPLTYTKIIELSNPVKGDVVVFRFPVKPEQNYIKRVVGVGGDVVAYSPSGLLVNGITIPAKPSGEWVDSTGDNAKYQRREEVLGGGRHSTVHSAETAVPVDPKQAKAFFGVENCSYTDSKQELTCKIPAGHYFVMGDNRDNSFDSRYWGLVADKDVVGKAVLIWFHVKTLITLDGLDFKRIGISI